MTDTLTLARWLVYWLETYVKPTAKPSGYAQYRDICTGHIIPAMGDTPLEAVTTAQLQAFFNHQKLPVVSLLRQAADGQVAALCRRLGISRETALGYPVTGAEQDEARMMEQADFAAKAREIFLALGVQEEALQAYSGLMDEMKGDGAEQEVNVCAYILRRDYITRLYNHTALSQQMISYLAGHAQADQKPYRPNDAELAAARLALEQTFSAAPCADGAAPVTVCCSVHTLAPGEILQITAAERGDPMVVTITGEPGTAVDVVLAQRLDPPEDAPVCRNTIHV